MIKKRKVKKRKVIFFSAIVILLFMTTEFFGVYTWAMSSTNYQVVSDSVNVGGIDFSSSASYELSDTIGENASGESESANYKMYAGYRQMEESYISVSLVDNSIDMSPNLGGISGGQANGFAEAVVKTDSRSGYGLYIKATTDPALTSGDYYFDDYSPAVVSNPDFDWGIETANSEFGFSPYNANNQDDFFKNNDSACNTGTSITDGKCWFGFSTTDKKLVESWERTDPETGDSTKINFRAEINTTNGFQIEGLYEAGVTMTVIAN
jgi:hypothetical protein